MTPFDLPGQGRDLAQILRSRGSITVGEAARAGAAVVRALQTIHQRGAVHGNVQPATILLADNGEVTLLEGAAAGDSADYAAPERSSGAPLTPPADLYSLGCTLFLLIAGHPPYRHSGEHPAAAEMAARHERGPVPNLASIIPGVEAPVADIVRRLMAKDPSARPQHGEVARVLTAVATDLSASLPRMENPGSLAGRTAHMAVSPRSTLRSQAHADPEWFRAAKWAVVMAVLLLFAVAIFMAIP